MQEELGIIEGAQCGMRDTESPVLWFSVKTLRGHALQVLSWEQAAELIKAAGVYSVENLNGQGVVVKSDGSTVTFDRFAA